MEYATDYAVFMANGKIVEKGFVEELKEKYALVHGSADILSKVSDRLISYTGNKTMFEGIALTENRSQLEKYDIAIEVPTLQQLSVGILRKAEKDNEVK
jgi:ABC-2 type transport system ATP-binding protein